MSKLFDELMRGPGRPRTQPLTATCHPERPAAVRGLCRQCYNKAHHRSHLVGKFGMTVEDVSAMLRSQNGLCANEGCRRPLLPSGQSPNSLTVDHDHETHMVRGLLCTGCNKALGFVDESIERLQGLTSYLRKYPKSPVDLQESSIG